MNPLERRRAATAPQLAPLQVAARHPVMLLPRYRYPSDTSDLEWALLERLLPTPACQTSKGGAPEKWPRRRVVDAIRYITDNGAKRRAALLLGVKGAQVQILSSRPALMQVGGRSLVCGRAAFRVLRGLVVAVWSQAGVGAGLRWR
ncbi:putative transposase of IS4/5 family DUF4096 [Streptomyces sp. Ag109_O5-1]|nr:putative transposase of IS4/5 family DUF4096 [Streptomyces sp. Ag109_O5-1]